MKKTQAQRVLEYLKTKKEVSTRDIMRDLFITRGPARILELKDQGHDIINTGKHDEYGFSIYRLQ